MISQDVVKLFRAPDGDDHWIGEDKRGGLVTWPNQRAGWQQRTPYTGSRRGLVEVEPALARGTGWPGAGGGRPPRSASGKPSGSLTIRLSSEERAAWTTAAEGRALSDWARAELNAIASRKRERRS